MSLKRILQPAGNRIHTPSREMFPENADAGGFTLPLLGLVGENWDKYNVAVLDGPGACLEANFSGGLHNVLCFGSKDVFDLYLNSAFVQCDFALVPELWRHFLEGGCPWCGATMPAARRRSAFDAHLAGSGVNRGDND